MPNTNLNNSDNTYLLVKQVTEQLQSQLKELNDNSKKITQEVYEVKIELAKLGQIKNEINFIDKRLEAVESYKKDLERIVTPEDIRKLKLESENNKKFQVQLTAFCFTIYTLVQVASPYLFKIISK